MQQVTRRRNERRERARNEKQNLVNDFRKRRGQENILRNCLAKVRPPAMISPSDKDFAKLTERSEELKKLMEVAPTGDRLKTLETLRDVIANAIDGTTSARDIAALSRQMTEVLTEIDEIKSHSKVTEMDSIESIKSRFKVAK